MAVVRFYEMRASEGNEAKLADVLQDLAAQVSAIDGCLGIHIWRDQRDPSLILFAERWSSVEAHKSAARQLPPTVFSPLLAVVSAPPAGRYFEDLGDAQGA